MPTSKQLPGHTFRRIFYVQRVLRLNRHHCESWQVNSLSVRGKSETLKGIRVSVPTPDRFGISHMITTVTRCRLTSVPMVPTKPINVSG